MIYRKPTFEFSSVFARYIREYIELRESFGAQFRVQSGILRQFDRYCVSIDVQEPILNEKIITNWLYLTQGEAHSTRRSRITTLKLFSDYLASIGCQVSWVPHPGYGSCKERYIPHIYSEDEIRRILTIAEKLPKPQGRSMFHLIFPVILKMMYCCGLRVSETLELRVKDVDLNDGSIFVYRSKFENSRRLPVSRSLLNDLRIYRDANRELIGVDEESFFFPNANGGQYSQRTVYDKFRTVLWSSEIPHQGRGKGPRVHDLRHTFAVRSLQQSIMDGKDLYVFLPILMSYLGHIKLSSTEYYLRLTAEIFPDFLRRSDTICAAAIPEVCEYD